MRDDLAVDEPGLSPDEELQLADLRVREAELDEEVTMWDPEEHPKEPHNREEAVTSRDGSRVVDVQGDTIDVDGGADFDLSMDDLTDADLDF